MLDRETIRARVYEEMAVILGEKLGDAFLCLEPYNYEEKSSVEQFLTYLQNTDIYGEVCGDRGDIFTNAIPDVDGVSYLMVRRRGMITTLTQYKAYLYNTIASMVDLVLEDLYEMQKKVVPRTKLIELLQRLVSRYESDRELENDQLWEEEAKKDPVYREAKSVLEEEAL